MTKASSIPASLASQASKSGVEDARGRGESVWLAWFLLENLELFAGLARDRNDQEQEQRQRSGSRLAQDGLPSALARSRRSPNGAR
jgi:hypothetical protein